MASAAVLQPPTFTLSDACVRTMLLPDVDAALSEPAYSDRSLGQRVEVEVRSPTDWHPARALANAAVQMAAFIGMRPGWNSYGAKPVAPTMVAQVLQEMAVIFEATTPSPQVVPTVRGGLQIEWHKAGVDIEIYFDPASETEFYAAYASGERGAFEGRLRGNEELLRRWLGKLK